MPIKQITIMVAVHKEYEFPDDDGYLPIHVGKQNSLVELGIEGDNTGINISKLNPYFCELTGLYWMWKNVESEYYGLSHYRRYFLPVNRSSFSLVKGKKIASSTSLMELLNEYEVVLSKPRNYFIETIESHYKNAHEERDLVLLKGVMSEVCPEYLPELESVLQGKKVSLYNMFIMNRTNFESYCDWLFSLLIPLKDQIPYKSYGPYQKRVFGFLAERLLNVWVLKNFSNDKIYHASVINLEGESLVDKAKGLLLRKFFGSKQS
ncbi:DUF4422 domain-containing protein [Oligella urethralis]|uniref:DUF4422 domain-containing protein n=1 Tax=Oligella urethralis TaxID=90245 RepID=UPI00242F9BE8|nr:DUF4422 domain-containing protein [Oligella urethralis]